MTLTTPLTWKPPNTALANPLAVHMDNGWNSEKAVVNIKHVTRKLGMDYQAFATNDPEILKLRRRAIERPPKETWISSLR